MANIKAFSTDFNDIAKKVMTIAKTENSYIVSDASDISHDVTHFTDYGLAAFGKTVSFPAQFVQELNKTSPALASEIIRDRVSYYFERENRPFITREFQGKVCGVVSDKYVMFDDKQVIEIIETSPLANLKYAHSLVTPERLHFRAIDYDHPFKINDDDSPLYFCYFVDNSMVGMSSFKIQFGVYRLACTNGMILPIKEFVLCKQVHRGNKSIAAEFNASISFLDEKKDDIKALLTDISTAESALEGMKEEHRATYLARALNISHKEADKVITLYSSSYGGKTKWDLVNAITEFARDSAIIDRREYLEKKALQVA